MGLTPVLSLLLTRFPRVLLFSLLGLAPILGDPVASRKLVTSRKNDPVTFTTNPQSVRFRVGAHPETFQGRATLTLVEALPDDSLRAIVVITMDEAERVRFQKQFPLGSSPPAPLGHRELRLQWRTRTSCPDLEIDLPALTFEAAGLPLTTIRSRLKIEVPLISSDPLPQLLCSWTRQINARRPREGVIMAINRLLIPS